ncbi:MULTISPECIES: Lrp/AsnC family transcriptional regulator [Acinetobacter]|jgi:Lrp/AsnC family transcriptional regulator, leucine-responsive regulatory protein|uniref:HTH-type transcriptional regulator LrpC n=3 Tax=Acinetobacter calcoaceticus/baumannii complex TaxID=909768 RepID=A0A0Q1GMZ4_ACIBA|nr:MULTISPECIES: winged helix-turn-helix transcriptional regulator [Acinetobacter]CAH1087010.1 leucine-responsive transcriptional regulator [Acinetobacter phage MD-2021a]AJB46753.1 transcriptional regulator [Acinetobacter nosocomialis]ARG15410.1 AsnC family protein [Acinetobacter nosocomialis]ARG34861.1 AsnC family protein [Acinetobacter baumannii]AVF46175.1 AsnC family protein [Acinetobacter nosocomialis]
MNIELDPIDLKIIALLKQDSRLTNKEIGQRVHRTGQAVGARIAQLMDAGVIKNYTIAVQYLHKQFIHLHLNEQRAFEEIENLVKQYEQIDECFKVMGNACYMIVSHFEPAALNEFIEVLSKWCRYSVETVVREVEKS